MRKSAIAYFAAGAILGAVVTTLCLRNHYEQIAQEEIDSVKSVFAKKAREGSNPIITKPSEKPNSYDAILQRNGYRSEGNIAEKMNAAEKPYIISPDEFGEFDDYEKVSLTYYADRILADDNDDLVDDIEQTVGLNSLNHFGEYEDDSVFVRNDSRRCDYEILLDQRAYADVVKGK